MSVETNIRNCRYKFDRLKSLLDFADSQQRDISDEYSEYLDGNIPTSCKIKLKNYFENARSVLDYIASDICVHVLKLNEKHRCYFPICTTSQRDFDRFCEINFPQVEKIAPNLHSLLASIQPFSSADFAPLKALAAYTNENKHRDFTGQSIVEEHHAARRFLVIRLEDVPTLKCTKGMCDGFMVADETKSDPFLGSDFILGSIGKVIEFDPTSFRYVAPKFVSSGEDVIVTLIKIQSALRAVVAKFAEPLYGQVCSGDRT